MRFVDDHQADYPITVLCRLVELSRATFYRWANPDLSDRYLDDAYLANEIVDIHRTSRRTYGSPRVWGQLRRSGVRVGEKRVARIMAEIGLIGAHWSKGWIIENNVIRYSTCVGVTLGKYGDQWDNTSQNT